MLHDRDGDVLKCFECDGDAAHLHHVVPRSKGGQRTVPLCQSCHALVHFRTDDTGSLIRQAYLNARAQMDRPIQDELVVAPVPTSEPPDPPAGLTRLENFPRLVREADLRVTASDRRQSRLNGESPEFYARLRARIRAPRF